MNIIILLLISSILNTISVLVNTNLIFKIINLGISIIAFILAYKKYRGN